MPAEGLTREVGPDVGQLGHHNQIDHPVGAKRHGKAVENANQAAERHHHVDQPQDDIDEDLRLRLISTLEQIRDAKESSIHVEQQIYDGFYCVNDDEILQQFHDIPWSERKQLISRLSDPRLRKLAARLLFFERPELLDDEARRAVEQDTTLRLMQDSAPDVWLTLPNAIEEIDELLPIATDKESNCLRGHRALLLKRMQELAMS